jgi:hypothetical protein
MALLNDKFSKFRGYISISGNGISPGIRETDKTLADYITLLNQEEVASTFLGRDFFMAREFTEGGLYINGKDLSNVSGILNYAQAITHRLMTYRGTMPGDAAYGMPWNNYLGKTYKNKSLIIANLTQDLEDEVFKDRRTASVKNITVEFLDPNTITSVVSLVPIYTGYPPLVEVTVTSGE